MHLYGGGSNYFSHSFITGGQDTVMRNIKAVIAYDGSRYYGFQAQLNPEVLPTVQGVQTAVYMRLGR